MAANEADQRAARAAKWGQPGWEEAQAERELQNRIRRVEMAKILGEELRGKFKGFTLTPSLHGGLLPTPVYEFVKGKEVRVKGVVGRRQDAVGLTDNVYFVDHLKNPKGVGIQEVHVSIKDIELENDYLANK